MGWVGLGGGGREETYRFAVATRPLAVASGLCVEVGEEALLRGKEGRRVGGSVDGWDDGTDGMRGLGSLPQPCTPTHTASYYHTQTYLEAVDAVLGAVVQVFEAHALAGHGACC